MAGGNTEKEILRIQYGEGECLSEVLELGEQFSADTVEGAAQMALNAIEKAGDSFQSDDHRMQVDRLTEELERVEGGIRDLQERAERIRTNMAALAPIDGSEVREMIEDLLGWTLGKLYPGNSMGIGTVAFKSYADLDKGGDMNCCAVFYRGRQIFKKDTE